MMENSKKRKRNIFEDPRLQEMKTQMQNSKILKSKEKNLPLRKCKKKKERV